MPERVAEKVQSVTSAAKAGAENDPAISDESLRHPKSTVNIDFFRSLSAQPDTNLDLTTTAIGPSYRDRRITAGWAGLTRLPDGTVPERSGQVGRWNHEKS